MSWRDPITKTEFILITAVFLTVTSIVFLFIFSYVVGLNRPKETVNSRLVLDCNRPDGHKVWNAKSITFYNELELSIRDGNVVEKVDASDWLCSIESEVVKE